MKEQFVVLFRHGIAEPHGSGPDDERALTDTGRKRMAEIAPRFAEIFPKAKRVISSPLKRAVQTAEYLARSLALDVELSDALRPGRDPEEARKLIASIGERRLILVGHEPSLTSIMLHLTKLGSGGGMELKKGGCYAVRIADGDARLEWMLAPRVLRS